MKATFTTMKAFSVVAGELTALPATDDNSGIRAWVSFAMLRTVEGVAPNVEASPWLQERLRAIRRAVPDLGIRSTLNWAA